MGAHHAVAPILHYMAIKTLFYKVVIELNEVTIWRYFKGKGLNLPF